MKKPTVLIIDDLPNDRKRLQQILTPEFECYLAINGYQALKLFKELKPNVVLCDVEMPAIDGFEVCQKIRLQNNEVKIALVSAHTDPQIRIKANDSGVDDFIEKNWTKELILSQIKHLYQRPTVKHIEENKKPFEGQTTLEKVENHLVDFYSLPSSRRKKKLLCLEDLCNDVFHKSKSSVQRKIKKDTGKNFTEIHTGIRMSIAVDLLIQQNKSLDDISEWLNYSQPSHFSQAFKRVIGRTPSRYKMEYKNRGL